MGKGVGPDKVTPRQRACYEMRRSGSTWEEIALAMDMSPQTARNHVKAAERNGLPAIPATKHKMTAGAAPDPEELKKLAEALATGAAPNGQFDLKQFHTLAAAAGVPARLAAALGRRVAANYGKFVEVFTRETLQQQIQKTTDKAQFVLEHIDEVSIAGMNAKDLAMAYGILVDKAQLLGGKPTQVYDFNVRAKLEVLMPQFLAEAKRRGITVDGEFSHVPDKPAVTTDAPAVANGVVVNG